MSNFRVRYGRLSGSRHPKNTLVTFRQDDEIYFGISRCNFDKGDRFLKRGKSQNQKGGVERAQEKALSAPEILSTTTFETEHGTVTLHESGLLGRVQISEVRALLEYFENIDRLMLEKALANRRRR